MTKYRWIREDINLDFELPKVMQNLIIEMKQMDLNEDCAYDNYFDALDVEMKERVKTGQFTQKQWDLLYEKYCGEV